MSDKDLTDWFPGHIKPVRHGVYERLYDEKTPFETKGFCLFSGAWYMVSTTPEGASMKTIMSGLQNLKWRGLRKP